MHLEDPETVTGAVASLVSDSMKTRPNLSEENELVLQLTDTEFIKIVEAGPGGSATDFKPDNRNRRTNLVATNDYEEFTFLTRITRSNRGVAELFDQFQR